MQLHQLLRFINFTTPLRILDIEGIEICKVNSKLDIDLDLYEYLILEISSGVINLDGLKNSIFITIQK